MKKIIVIAIAAVLLLSGCGGNEPAATPTPEPATPTPTGIVTTPEATSTPEATQESTPTPTVEPTATVDNSRFSLPQILVDRSNIYVSLEDVVDNQNHDIELIFSLSNRTGNDIVYTIKSISINNMVMPFYYESVTVKAGIKGTYSFSYSKQTLQEYGIDEAYDIQFHYGVVEQTGYTTLHDNVYHLQGKTQWDQYAIGGENTLVASNEYLNVYWVNAYKDAYGDEYYQMVIENKTEMVLTTQMTAIAINNVSVLSHLNVSMLPSSILLYRGYVSSADSSFIKDYGVAASVEMEFLGTDALSEYHDFELTNKYILDDSVDLSQTEYAGQNIFSYEDVTIGINKLYDEYNGCNQLELYVKNDRIDTAYLSIYNMLLDDGSIGGKYDIAVLPGSYSTQIIELENYIADADHSMSFHYEIRYNYTDTPQLNGLSFTLNQ